MSERKTVTDSSGFVYVIGTEEEGLKFIGRESEPFEQPWPIDVKGIQHLAESVEDPNPLYWSDEFGKQTRWGGRIANWGDAWLLGGEHDVWRPAWWERKDAASFSYMTIPLPGTRLLATNYEVECYVPFRPGDRIISTYKVADIIPKTYRIGIGHVIVMENYLRNQKGELCIKDKRWVFRYQPVEVAAGSQNGAK